MACHTRIMNLFIIRQVMKSCEDLIRLIGRDIELEASHNGRLYNIIEGILYII